MEVIQLGALRSGKQEAMAQRIATWLTEHKGPQFANERLDLIQGLSFDMGRRVFRKFTGFHPSDDTDWRVCLLVAASDYSPDLFPDTPDLVGVVREWMNRQKEANGHG